MNYRWFLPLSIVILTLMITPFLSASATEKAEKNTISVTGKGEILIQPDVAYVRLGLVTQGSTATEAQKSNADTFTQIQKALMEQGLKPEDMKTVQFSTFPNYQWEKDKQVLKGYQTQHILLVTYRDINRVGQLLDAVTQAGANQIEGVQYGAEKQEEYEIQVLHKAMDHARRKADALAAQTGKKVTGVLHISEPGTASPLIFRGHELAEAKAMDTASTVISPGELKIEAQVQVVYEF
ncbi:SIMPL domain-containing protein [Ammoniphilus sp. YIM 78166]|uniref:SIMPL domain-containing protein n=1 Tax=Ammoniphilus sp. YIM 78166 TaxID=1644106 RepID=UPI00106F2286|nr:SIMPL domain-containing protein [Ammoniphilus sp. YIM 78166]